MGRAHSHRQLGCDGAAVGPRHRHPGRRAADRAHRLGGGRCARCPGRPGGPCWPPPARNSSGWSPERHSPRSAPTPPTPIRAASLPSAGPQASPYSTSLCRSHPRCDTGNPAVDHPAARRGAVARIGDTGQPRSCSCVDEPGHRGACVRCRRHPARRPPPRAAPAAPRPRPVRDRPRPDAPQACSPCSPCSAASHWTTYPVTRFSSAVDRVNALPVTTSSCKPHFVIFDVSVQRAVMRSRGAGSPRGCAPGDHARPPGRGGTGG